MHISYITALHRLRQRHVLCICWWQSVGLSNLYHKLRGGVVFDGQLHADYYACLQRLWCWNVLSVCGESDSVRELHHLVRCGDVFDGQLHDDGDAQLQ